MIILSANKASRGIAIGTAYVYNKSKETSLETSNVCDSNNNLDKANDSIKLETKLFKDAVLQLDAELQKQAESCDIFQAHIEMLHDAMLEDACVELIENGSNALQAISEAQDAIVGLFERMENNEFANRLDDIKDICSRLKQIIINATSGDSYCFTRKPKSTFENLPENSIIVADELYPSDTTHIDFTKVKAILTEKGSSTSHVCIIAANKGIPALVGIESLLQNIKNNEPIIVDADNAKIYINPDETALNRYQSSISAQKKSEIDIPNNALVPIYNKKGERIHIYANAGSLEDIEIAVKNGAEGIGLFRTEFLFMNGTELPNEEEQFEIYRKAVSVLENKVLTIRVLDAGGDKKIPCLKFPKEENPFLGYRGIRMLLKETEILKTQFKAILRASAYGKIRIMLPMISCSDEVLKAKEILEQCKNELSLQAIKFDEKIELGIMIETPAAVFMADKLAEIADFFSIGTNDLTQYIMAADRGNSMLDYLLDSSNEAVTAAIASTITAAQNANIEVGMCGEYASNPSATDKLLELGLREFSVNSFAISILKHRINSSN